MTKRRLAIVEVLGALIAGCLLYLLARPRGLVAFGWFEAVGLGGTLSAARVAAQPYANALPSFVRFSVTHQRHRDAPCLEPCRSVS